MTMFAVIDANAGAERGKLELSQTSMMGLFCKNNGNGY